MDVGTISGLVSSVGFPVVCVGLTFWFIKYMYDCTREDTKATNQTIDNMVEKYGELSVGLNKNTEAIKNQSEAILKLINRVCGDG